MSGLPAVTITIDYHPSNALKKSIDEAISSLESYLLNEGVSNEGVSNEGVSNEGV